jgi:molecular chaperone GrpE
MFDCCTFAHIQIKKKFMQDTEKTIPVTEDEQMDLNSDADLTGNTDLSNSDEHAENFTEKLEAEIQEQKDKYLRLFAEFDNYKRRTAKERLELMQTAGKEMAIALLDVADDMDRAEKQIASDDDINHVKEGVQLVFNKLRNLLQQKGIVAMSSIDTDFDVEKHEAVTEIPAGEDKVGKVVDELQKGYYMNEKLIRFAKVVVGK